MPLFAAFCGGSQTERATALDAELTVNLFRSGVEAVGSPKPAGLYGTPGTRVLGEVATSGARGMFSQDGRTWAVIGAQLYELTFGPYTQTARGTIVNDGAPVSFASNGDGGSQLAIVGGGELKILNLVTHALSAAVVLPLTRTPLMIGFLDGYFLMMERDSLLTWFSNIENGLVWDALDFFTRSTASDRLVAGVCANNRYWAFGSESTEAYEDVGDADNPFQPIKGSLFQIGAAAAWAVSIGVSTIRWLGRSKDLGVAVYRLDGYGGTRISTHAIEAQLRTATTLADAEALTYGEDGHVFYALTCPSLGVAGDTPVYDETEHQWHHRRYYNAALGREEAWRVRGHAFVGMLHVCGGRTSSQVWALDLETYDDAGEILRAWRAAPYLGAENVYAFLNRIELGVDAGVGLNSGQGSDPHIELLISKDLGHTWWSVGNASIGAAGIYDANVFWTRMGRVRIDRLVIKVVLTDPVKRMLGPGLWVDATPGRRAA